MDPRARVRTRSASKTAAVCLLALAAGVCLAACDTGYKFSTSGNQAPGSGGAASGNGATSSTARAPTAAPCTARDLIAKGGRRQDANDAGGAVGDVVVSDPTTAACELRGAPSIGLVKVGGAALDVS